MSSQNDTYIATERRSRTRKEIKQLIEKRNSVLARYYNLAKDAESDTDDLNSTLEMLQEFCQELVDYMALGHFEIYRRIEEGNERRDDITKLADRVMPRISDTTQVAIAFNDLYDDTSKLDEAAVTQLPNYLARLGEELATRIDLEDQFINTLLESQQPEKATAPA